MGRTHGGELNRGDQRAMLMERMLEAVASGAVTPHEELPDRELEAAFRRCFRCDAADTCRRWLDGQARELGYRDFCPNAGLFRRMALIKG